MFTIDCDYPGGNIIVKSIRGNEVFLSQDLRDTDRFWFYYNFRVSGADGKTLTFYFEDAIVSPFGPAVSFDGKEWNYLPHRFEKTEKSFCFHFGEAEKTAYFAFSLPYQSARLDDKCKEYRHIVRKSLCLSEKGREVYILESGRGDRNIAFSCRHHCCESVASYVLEGILDEIERNEKYRRKFKFYILPFADIDGVEEGDQGKSRKPHDHDADYTQAPIYNCVRSWAALMRDTGICAGIDLHDPYMWGGSNDHLVIVYHRNSGKALEKFAQLLDDATAASPVRHVSDWDIRWGTQWNTEQDTDCIGTARYFYSQCGADVSCALEIPYFGENGYTTEDLKMLGRDILKALDTYFK